MTVQGQIGFIKRQIKIEKNPEKIEKFLEILSTLESLVDPKTLFITWAEEDFQMIARRDLSYENNLDEEDLIENPLSEEKIIKIVDFLEHYYDCNQGISWEDISSAIKEIGWPDIKDCLIKK